MTKTKWTLAILLAVAVLSTVFVRSKASNHHQDHQHQPQTSAPLPPLIADGATDPSAIPDLIAYEILLNSVADGVGTGEFERLRAKAFAEKTSLARGKVELLKGAANTFREQMKSLDAQVMELKDRHWPKPDQAVLHQLSALQREKEEILNKAFNSLLDRLNEGDKEKLNSRLLEIKKKVKVYQEPPVEAFEKKEH